MSLYSRIELHAFLPETTLAVPNAELSRTGLRRRRSHNHRGFADAAKRCRLERPVRPLKPLLFAGRISITTDDLEPGICHRAEAYQVRDMPERGGGCVRASPRMQTSDSRFGGLDLLFAEICVFCGLTPELSRTA